MKYLILIGSLVFAATAWAEEAPKPPTPPWLHPEVLKAGGAMDLTEEQMPKFRESLTQLIADRTRATNRLLQRNNVSNLDRKLKTASNRQFKKMDKRMAKILTDEQYPQYETYRDVLKAKMGEVWTGTSSAQFDRAGSALNGGADL